ncbi:MAG: hypothetical protein EHM62_03635 [Methylococcus sp.]|nr:MAG: hypothetical protein EHM62_03635 [Methylococcus sp.]
MFSFVFKIFNGLGSLLPLLGALQLMKFTLNDQLATFGLRIPVWVTGATVVAFTAVFLVSMTALMMGRNRPAPTGFTKTAPQRRRSRPTSAGVNDGNQSRYRQRLKGLSNYT